jgi:hypothetical protein
MTGQAPLGNEATADWTLKGHFFVGGSGLYVHRNCVGQTFTSHTANYTLILGLPQLDTGPEDRSVLVPPEWTCGPGDKNESSSSGTKSPGVQHHPARSHCVPGLREGHCGRRSLSVLDDGGRYAVEGRSDHRDR